MCSSGPRGDVSSEPITVGRRPLTTALGSSEVDQRTLFFLSFLPAVVALSLTVFAVPRFAALYEMTQSALPILTLFWFDWYVPLAFSPIVILLVPWRLRASFPRRGLHALLFSVASSLALVGFGAWVCCSPLFSHGW
jgi:hypothetical protein